MSAAGTSQISAAHSGVNSRTCSRNSSPWAVRASMNSRSTRPSACDDVRHRQQQRDIRADADRKVEVGDLCQADLARVGDDHLRAAGERLLQARRGDGVALGHVRPDGEDDIGLLHVGERVAHRAASDRGCQTGNRGSVSGSTTVVYVVRPVAGADELLHRVGGLVRRAPGGDAVDRMVARISPSPSRSRRRRRRAPRPIRPP